MTALASLDTYESFINQLEDFLHLLLSGQKRLDNVRFEASFVLSNFAVNSSELTDEHRGILDDLAATILSQGVATTDNTAVATVIEFDQLLGRASQTGNEENNLELSRARAEAVRRRLSDSGLSYLPAVTALGSSEPLIDSDQDEIEINRSVEVKMLVSMDASPLEEELDHWEDIAEHTIPDSVKTILDDRDFNIQTLENAHPDAKTNLDFYQVRITQMPEKSPGVLYTMPELLNEIRLNFSDLISLFNSDDNPHVPVFYKLPMLISPIEMAVTAAGYTRFNPYSAQDEAIWLSDSPLGAVMQFDSLGEDMGVVCTAYEQDYWIFTTVGDARLGGDIGTHPVSGNRKFGYFQDTSGHNVVYTKGIDRTSGTLETAADFAVFHGGHLIWVSFQAGVKKYVEERGGSAEILRPSSNRSDHADIQAHFFDQ